MGKTVIEAEGIRKKVIEYLIAQEPTLTEKDIETVCDTYIKYYVMRVDPVAIERICKEVNQ